MQKLADQLRKMAKPGGLLEDFEINYVSWSPNAKHPDMQTGNFTRHMEIIRQTDIHVSGPGTGQMYQTFLPDGAVHVNLGQLITGGDFCLKCKVMQGFMEEYMAEGAPYLKVLFHPQYKTNARVTRETLTPLIQEAGWLLRLGIPARPPAIGAKLSPVTRVFKAYSYLVHRETVGIEALRNLAPNWEPRGETWLGNNFPEDIIYAGGDHHPWLKQNVCLLSALRASYDKTFPDIGRNKGRGWFNTVGVFDATNFSELG